MTQPLTSVRHTHRLQDAQWHLHIQIITLGCGQACVYPIHFMPSKDKLFSREETNKTALESEVSSHALSEKSQVLT